MKEAGKPRNGRLKLDETCIQSFQRLHHLDLAEVPTFRLIVWLSGHFTNTQMHDMTGRVLHTGECVITSSDFLKSPHM